MNGNIYFNFYLFENEVFKKIERKPYTVTTYLVSQKVLNKRPMVRISVKAQGGPSSSPSSLAHFQLMAPSG